MILPSMEHPAHPPLALRVGITGLRKLHATEIDRLRHQVRALLAQIRTEMQHIAKIGSVTQAYSADGEPLTAQLWFFSPLARGSDRLAAEEALQAGYRLHVPMPFPRCDYENDFTGAQEPYEPPLTAAEDLRQFNDAIAKAGDAWLSLDGDRATARNRSYEAVGRFVARHCDLLIAIWDGGEGSGRGGTSDIMRYATNGGPPVCWVHATEDRPPRWINDAEDLRHLGSAPAATTVLPRYLHRLICPPEMPHRHAHRHHIVFDPIARLIDGGWALARRAWAYAKSGPGKAASPERWFRYFHEVRLPHRRLWQTFTCLLQRAARESPPRRAMPRPAWPPSAPDQAPAQWWNARYVPADDLATSYADRYRSAYVLVFLLAAAAVILGVSALWVSGLPGVPRIAVVPPVFLEFLCLVGIFALVLENHRRDWQSRSIEYRLLAELCRKQQALSPLGWSVSAAAAQGAVVGPGGRMRQGTSPHEPAAWVVWLFNALQRAAPLPRGAIDATALSVARDGVMHDLLGTQFDYHRTRRRRMGRASVMFAGIGEITFFAILIAVIVKLLAINQKWESTTHLFGLLAAMLPAISAASVGVRAYAEMQLLAAQSHRMRRMLVSAKARLNRLDLRRPMASQDLGAETARVATLMLQDLEGWAQLFQVKVVEPG